MKFTVITEDSTTAIRVKRFVENIDRSANVLRTGCKLIFYSSNKSINTRTFRTMSRVIYSSAKD